MSKNQQISSFLGFYFIVGTPLNEAISYLLQYDHVIPEADARRLINTYYYYYLNLHSKKGKAFYVSNQLHSYHFTCSISFQNDSDTLRDN